MKPRASRSVTDRLISEANCLAGYCQSAKFILSMSDKECAAVVMNKTWFEELLRRVDKFDALLGTLTTPKKARKSK